MRNLFTLLLFMVYTIPFAYSQTGSVSGTVKDGNSQMVLPGVTVTVQGKSISTQTDASGKYTINATGTDVLLFNFIGFSDKSVPVNNLTTVDVFLDEEDQSIDEVVVVGYGTQRKVDLTGSIASVKGSEIANMPNSNPISSLQGKVAGLTISNSGIPGASPTVRIRGVNSTNSASPLYVVDGVLHDNIDFLSPGDIENIDVLRDPSSIAIYGLRGANGVIAITLKKAARGKTLVNFQGSIGFNRILDRIDVTDAEGFKELYNAQLANLGADPFDYTNYTANTDWQDLIIRDAINTNNSLSISNSSEKTSTHISVGYNKQDGVIKNSSYDRYVARLNEEIRINDRIRVGGDFSGTYWKTRPNVVTLTNALWAAPIVPVQYDATTYYSMPSFQRAQVGNPIAALNRLDNTSMPRGYRFVGSLFAEFEIIKDLKWKSTVYTDLGFNNTRSYTPLPFSYINLGENGGLTDTTYDNTLNTGVSQSQEEFRRFQQDHTLTYDLNINDEHRITLLGGFTTVYNDNTFINGNRRDTTVNVPNDPDYWYLGIINGDSNPGTFNGGGSKNSLAGAFARINYAYNNKYLLNATIRRDGSSKFAPENRWGTFGSVGIGWVLTQEKFFEDIEKINFMKLRFAWGKIGNSNGVADNLYQPGISNASTAIFGDNIYTAIQASYIPDPNLHWEVVRGLDLGLEVKAFDNRFSGEINLYDRTTSDILTAVPLPNDTRNYFTNLGEITNRGIEITLGWNNSIGELRYAVNGNFSYNKNVVNSIGDNINFQILGNNGANKTETGQSIGYFYGYKQTGIYQTVSEIEDGAAMTNSLPGDIAYEDIDGNGIINTEDRTYLGTPFPPYNFGLSLNLSYKQFDFLIEGNGVAGNHIYAIRRTSNFAVLNYESNRLNAWTGPGTSNIEPILDNSRGNNYLFSTYFLEPGDYFRLRTLQVGYTFKTNALGNSIKNARVFLSGQNIQTWSKVTGYSPEASISSITAGGTDNASYPIPVTYTFGINLTF